MSRRMRYTMVVRHPDTLVATPLVGGSEVPGWADGLIDDADTTEGETPTAVEPAAPVASPPVEEVTDTTEGETPSESWTNAQLRQYAEGRGIDLQGATTKAAILEALSA